MSQGSPESVLDMVMELQTRAPENPVGHVKSVHEWAMMDRKTAKVKKGAAHLIVCVIRFEVGIVFRVVCVIESKSRYF
jgi:hypothetical protein